MFIQKLKQIFEEGLELQKARLREQSAYTKELHQENYRKYKDEIEAMENYYRDQVKTVFIHVCVNMYRLSLKLEKVTLFGQWTVSICSSKASNPQ